ncbi:hypothetical protein CEXT_385211 [Caerostris extrusa]|uniref:Uncharacterized protein n=1 Tax=Caerostris extrusa TaxID=172846 RepID=A0AAV4UR67_CAEEX|nr:hypothetical protein CEXT_385211 [Caerostris extrusa]
MKHPNKVSLTKTILEISTTKIGKILPSFQTVPPSWYEIGTINFSPSTAETRFLARNMSPHSDPWRRSKSHISQENNFSSFAKQKTAAQKGIKDIGEESEHFGRRSKRGFGTLR